MVINKRWLALNQAERTELRENINEFLFCNHQVLPRFITNKLVKILVDNAKMAWDHEYTRFFTDIVQVAIVYLLLFNICW